MPKSAHTCELVIVPPGRSMPFTGEPKAWFPAPVGTEARSANIATADMLEMVTLFNCGEALAKDTCWPKRIIELESCVAEVLLLKVKIPHWPGAPCVGPSPPVSPAMESSASEVM